MKTTVEEHYWDNGRLMCRYHLTNDGIYHGLYESYKLDGSIFYLRYYHMDRWIVKLENYYPTYTDKIEIRYYI